MRQKLFFISLYSIFYRCGHENARHAREMSVFYELVSETKMDMKVFFDVLAALFAPFKMLVWYINVTFQLYFPSHFQFHLIRVSALSM